MILNESRIRNSTKLSDTDSRTPFESDFGRIIFSPAIRRMHDKTQVVPLNSDDNVHTRLTHSLEVQSLAYSMGIRLCNEKDFLGRINLPIEKALRIIPPILSSIALCHDIGNPPFGHYGEKVISKYFEKYFIDNPKIPLTVEERKDFTQYDGNAQGLRILCRQQVLQDTSGLNLTIGVLSAYMKYPNLSGELIDKGFRSKLGVFQSEKDILNEIRNHTGLVNTRNPLTFLMEAADNICYNVMDLEDGFNSGYFSFAKLYSNFAESHSPYIKGIVSRFDKQIETIDLVGTNCEKTKMVKFRILLIDILVRTSIESFLLNLDKIESGVFDQELLCKENNPLIKLLSKLNWELVITKREVQALELTGESVIEGLLDHFTKAFVLPELSINEEYKSSVKSLNDRDLKDLKIRADKLFGQISGSLKTLMKLETGKENIHEVSEYFKLRIIVDYISGMTDRFALSLYQKLLGIKI